MWALLSQGMHACSTVVGGDLFVVCLFCLLVCGKADLIKLSKKKRKGNEYVVAIYVPKQNYVNGLEQRVKMLQGPCR